jgi:hypothetical protein
MRQAPLEHRWAVPRHLVGPLGQQGCLQGWTRTSASKGVLRKPRSSLQAPKTIFPITSPGSFAHRAPKTDDPTLAGISTSLHGSQEPADYATSGSWGPVFPLARQPFIPALPSSLACWEEMSVRGCSPEITQTSASGPYGTKPQFFDTNYFSFGPGSYFRAATEVISP